MGYDAEFDMEVSPGSVTHVAMTQREAEQLRRLFGKRAVRQEQDANATISTVQAFVNSHDERQRDCRQVELNHSGVRVRFLSAEVSDVGGDLIGYLDQTVFVDMDGEQLSAFILPDSSDLTNYELKVLVKRLHNYCLGFGDRLNGVNSGYFALNMRLWLNDIRMHQNAAQQPRLD